MQETLKVKPLRLAAFDRLIRSGRLYKTMLQRAHHRSGSWQFATGFKRAALAGPPRRTVTCNRKPIASRTFKTVVKFGFLWIACKRTMNARPRKPRFLRKVRDIVQTGGGGNGVTNFGDIRLLKRSIYAIGSGLPAARLWAGRGPDGFFRHVTSNKKAGISADLVCWRSRNNARSVSRCDRRRRNRRSGS